MLDITKIGKRISISRQDKGFTQEELAKRLGITPQVEDVSALADEIAVIL